MDIEDFIRGHKYTNRKPSQAQDSSKWEPENWQEVLANIREYCSTRKMSDRDKAMFVTPKEMMIQKDLRYQTLVALVLKGASVTVCIESAMSRLREHGLSIPNIVNTEVMAVEKLIYPLVESQKKAKEIKDITKILHTKHQGELPFSLEKMMMLPHVNAKMALICLNSFRERTVLSLDGVDVANRLGWVRKPIESELTTMEMLKSWLPVELSDEVFHLLRKFSYIRCFRRKPACEECPNNTLCPHGKSSLKHLKDLDI